MTIDDMFGRVAIAILLAVLATITIARALGILKTERQKDCPYCDGTTSPADHDQDCPLKGAAP